jgi:hypothetical protein
MLWKLLPNEIDVLQGEAQITLRASVEDDYFHREILSTPNIPCSEGARKPGKWNFPFIPLEGVKKFGKSGGQGYLQSFTNAII